MSHATSYTCDCCRKHIGELYGPLKVQITGTKEPASDVGDIALDFCSADCFATWVREWSEGMR